MAAKRRVAIDGARQFLVGRFGAGVTDVSAIDHGEWSSTFSFGLDGMARVIRFGTHPDDYERDRFAATLAGAALPVPRILEIGEALELSYAISEQAFGAYLDDLDGPEFEAALPGLFAAMDAMREVSLPTGRFGNLDGSGRATEPDWRTYLLRVAEPSERLPEWRARLESNAAATAAFEAALERLKKVAPMHVEPHLVHSDLLNFNVLVQGAQPSAFLDWGCALAGDFLYDVAWLAYCQTWYPAWNGVDIIAAAKAHFDKIELPVPEFERRMEACLMHIGLGNLQYTAFAERWADLEDAIKRVGEVLSGAVGA